MKHIDDLFRDGLSGRKGEVPADLWNKIQSARPTPPAGEALDRQFSNALRDREAPVPPGMWDRIAAARAWPRRRAYWASAVAVLLLLVTLSIAYSWNTDNTKSTLPAAPANTFDSNPQDGPLAQAADPDQVFNSATPSRETTTTKPSTATSTTPALTGTQALALTEPPSFSSRRGADATPPAGPVTTGASDYSQDRTPLLLVVDEKDEESAAVLIDPALRAERDREIATESISALGTAPIEALPVATSVPGPFSDRHFRVRPTPNGGIRRAPRHRLQAEMLFGAMYANQNLSADDPADRPLLAARENSEFPEISYQLTLRGAYRLTDRLTLRSGLTYVDIRNQFDFEEIRDGALQLTRRNNHVRMLEMPVLLGLTLPSKRLHVTANLGPVFNITTAAQGKYLDPDRLEPLSLREDGNFRSYTGVGYMASLTTTYAIGKKDPFVVVLEPFFKHYPGSFTRPGSRISENYWLAGLQLGIRKSL